MIDLSQLNTVDVDPDKARAYAKGGALLNALDTAAREHGMITTAGVVSHTGVGGYTLGGGFGRLNRKFGLTIDNPEERGDHYRGRTNTSRKRGPGPRNLFWAIRGGGGNFGVVTEFEFQLHPFEHKVLCGVCAWPIEQARDVLDFYGEWSQGLSDDLYVGPAMLTMPDGQGVVAMEVVYAGYPS